MSDSPIKSNSERYADYLDQRRAAILQRTMEREEAVRRLTKEGVSKESAEKAVKEAQDKNRDPMRIKASEVRNKQGSLIKTYTKRSALAGCLPIVLIASLCIIPMIILAFGAIAIARPESILNKECLETAAGNKSAGIECLRNMYQTNNQTSFENQGLTI